MILYSIIIKLRQYLPSKISNHYITAAIDCNPFFIFPSDFIYMNEYPKCKGNEMICALVSRFWMQIFTWKYIPTYIPAPRSSNLFQIHVLLFQFFQFIFSQKFTEEIKSVSFYVCSKSSFFLLFLVIVQKMHCTMAFLFQQEIKFVVVVQSNPATPKLWLLLLKSS